MFRIATIEGNIQKQAVIQDRTQTFLVLFGNNAIIRTRQESECLPYTGFIGATICTLQEIYCLLYAKLNK